MNYRNLCYRCFAEKPTAEGPCPVCGCGPETHPNESCLAPGTLLNQRYLVGLPLGIGGFGITYKCFDTKISGICAVKEYFPTNFAERSGWGGTVRAKEQSLAQYNHILSRFVEESELLKKLRHKNIIRVYDTFFENATAYYTMEYCNGKDLRLYTQNFERRISSEEGMHILTQVMDGLKYIHDRKILHRDIAPDNIFITGTGMVKILDFGSARWEMDQLNRNLSIIVKMGYAPVEQYGSVERQGPYTDIYSLGATFYHVFTGKMPVESTKIAAGETMTPLSVLRPDLPERLRYVLERCMSLKREDRFQTIRDMETALGVTQSSEAGKDSSGGSVTSRETGCRASRKRRLGAYCLDLLVWGCVSFGVSLLAGGGNFTVLIAEAVFTLGDILCELIGGATPGKAILGLRVRSKENTVPDASQVILRNLIKMLGIFLVFGGREDTLDDRLTNSTVYRV